MTPTDSDFAGDASDPVRVEFQSDSDISPSMAIVQAIAVIEDVDPRELHQALGITLCDYVDPGALDQLVRSTGDYAEVTIEVTIHHDHQYSAQVRDTGHLVVSKNNRDES